MSDYDVIVIGGGHAGAEAATAAARLGAHALLVTSNLETIGQMSCNPAVGGVAKGTVVREVDAMGGVIGRAADRATIHFRMLNRSKGPGVWAPRAQCDRGLYRRAVRSLLEERPLVAVVQGMVSQLQLDGRRAKGVVTTDGRRYTAAAVVLTAGTFLRGRIHIGTGSSIPGGRAGDPPAEAIAQQLEQQGLTALRFKTGTPPRIDGRTVDYERLERQDGDPAGLGFAHYARVGRAGERPCWLTWAGDAVRAVIERDLDRSALYGGEISGRGPRYCPSIEDKIVKFPDAPRHQVFLEPEGLDTEELYVNGLSTSLPIETQVEFLRAVPGLEGVRMTRPGYAIEYDYYSPDQLTPWLESKVIEMLFLAGQVNGTTGYEEAAAQGLLAGINAARRRVDKEPVVLGREEAYVGVLTDDLVTKGVDEPYRLFTSRAEYRLTLRQDNAMKRLGPVAADLGMLVERELAVLEASIRDEERLRAASEVVVAPEVANGVLGPAGETPISVPQKVAELVRRPKVRLWDLLDAAGQAEAGLSEGIWLSVETELKYVGYVARERASARRLAELAEFELTPELPYASFASLSTEARQKLERIRPVSLAQASRIPGISPSDLQNLVTEVVKLRRSAA
jgi:tRNA uridine 5-carboxymethylaminomethyl modification enzyme